MNLLSPPFPDEMLPLVAELRRRVKRALGRPCMTYSDNQLVGSDYLMWWWERDDEIGIGDGSGKAFEPILRTISDSADPPRTKSCHVIEWGTPEEIMKVMEILRTNMVLDDLADV